MEKKPGVGTIDQYIANFPPPVRRLLQQVRATIRKAAPEATEAIAYQIPTFRLPGNLVHFAGYERHIGFYPAASGIAAFEEELSGYVHARGSVQFPLDQPIPYDLISRITAFRVRENLERVALRKAPKAKAGRKGGAVEVGRPGAKASAAGKVKATPARKAKTGKASAAKGTGSKVRGEKVSKPRR